MMSEWKQIALSETIEIISGGTPKTSVAEYWDGTIPWLSVADFNTGYRWVKTTEKSITQKGFENSATSILKPHDIIISARGTVGVLSQVAVPMAFNQSCYGVRAKDGVADTDFIYYALQHAVKEMKQVAHGGVFDTITRDTFKIIHINLPPLPEQRAIAHILGTLDDKIELNRQMNETLEAMARAIFKSWFVDFDPVRAKAEGRDTGLPEEIADLFPDSFEETELGEVPKGWTVKALPEAIQVNPSRSLRKGEIAPYLDMGNMPTTSARALQYYEREFGSGMKFVNNDTLVARITPCLENGKTCFVDFLEERQVGWGSTEYIVLSPKEPLSPEFAYFLARTEVFRAFAISNMTGTSGRQRVPAESLNQFMVAIPSSKIAERFGEFASLIIAVMKANDAESRTLAELRDTLLPKLISGELRLRETEGSLGLDI